MTRTLYLCGAGNSEGVRLANRINRHQARWDRIVLLDDDEKKHGKSLLGVPIEGSFETLANTDDQADVANLVARTTKGRRSARRSITRHGKPFARLIDPTVDLEGVELGSDVLAYQNAILGPEAVIGDGSVVFMGAIIGHESRVGPGCVVAANAVLNARVQLEEGVYVGTNATVLPETRIGAWATVAAGSVVVRDVPPGATVMGVPAKTLVHGADNPLDIPAFGDIPEESPAAISARMAPDGSTTTASELEALRRIWTEVLSVGTVTDDENFFDLGGHSLLTLRMQMLIHERLGVELPLVDLFRYTTVKSLAAHIRRLRSPPSTAPPEPTSRAALRGARRRKMLRHDSL